MSLSGKRRPADQNTASCGKKPEEFMAEKIIPLEIPV
jgi:hypothetical protein